MIYILGNSHSGSTLLSFLLSYHPDIINLGEIKSKTWLKPRICSCGPSVDFCPFYGGYFSTFNKLKEPSLESMRKVNPLQFLFRKKIKAEPDILVAIQSFYLSVSNRVSDLFPDAAYFTDSSKSVWLLNAWIQTVPVDKLRIIWIRRQLKANIASFVKRGSPFFSSLVTLMVNDWITKHFLKRNKLDYLEVNYDRFYEAYADEARLMSSFLGIDLPVTSGGHSNHHVISGNAKTRQAFANQFTGLHKDDEWQRILSPMQKKIVQWVS